MAYSSSLSLYYVIFSSTAIPFSEELTPAFIDEILTSLEPGVSQSEPTEDVTQTTKESEDHFKRTQELLETDKIEIKGTQLDTQFAKDILIKTANYFFNKGELDPSTDVPIASGRKRYIVNTEPTHKDGESFYTPRQLDCGLYLETHNSAD